LIELISLETIILIAGAGLAALIVGVVIGALAAGRSNKLFKTLEKHNWQLAAAMRLNGSKTRSASAYGPCPN
jgi:uncharacterized membrane-anchored protein YhcB (DUF1043 family)